MAVLSTENILAVVGKKNITFSTHGYVAEAGTVFVERVKDDTSVRAREVATGYAFEQAVGGTFSDLPTETGKAGYILERSQTGDEPEVQILYQRSGRRLGIYANPFGNNPEITPRRFEVAGDHRLRIDADSQRTQRRYPWRVQEGAFPREVTYQSGTLSETTAIDEAGGTETTLVSDTTLSHKMETANQNLSSAHVSTVSKAVSVEQTRQGVDVASGRVGTRNAKTSSVRRQDRSASVAFESSTTTAQTDPEMATEAETNFVGGFLSSGLIDDGTTGMNLQTSFAHTSKNYSIDSRAMCRYRYPNARGIPVERDLIDYAVVAEVTSTQYGQNFALKVHGRPTILTNIFQVADFRRAIEKHYPKEVVQQMATTLPERLRITTGDMGALSPVMVRMTERYFGHVAFKGSAHGSYFVHDFALSRQGMYGERYTIDEPLFAEELAVGVPLTTNLDVSYTDEGLVVGNPDSIFVGIRPGANGWKISAQNYQQFGDKDMRIHHVTLDEEGFAAERAVVGTDEVEYTLSGASMGETLRNSDDFQSSALARRFQAFIQPEDTADVGSTDAPIADL